MMAKKRNPFDPFKATKDLLEAEVSNASQALKAFPKGPTGLTPDSVRATSEWKAAKRRYDLAFAALRKFNSKKHKNPGSLAEEITEGFHGRKVREELEIEEEELIPDNTAVLGCLLDITVTRDDGKTGIPIIFLRDGQKPKRGEEVYVCAPDRHNIEFVGGDQHIANFSMLTKDKDKQLVCLGKVESLAYLADKHHLKGSNGKEEPYEHNFGKRKWFGFGKKYGRPELIYDTLNSKISLVGGTYTIEDEGITN